MLRKLLTGAMVLSLVIGVCGCTGSAPSASEKSAASSVAESSSGQESSKQESSKQESSKQESSKEESSKEESSKEESSKEESSKEESSKQESSKEESSKEESSKEESSKEESSKEESSKEKPSKQEPVEVTSEIIVSVTEPDESSQAPQKKPYVPAPAGTAVGSEWFNDALFIGDSVTLKLSYFAEDNDDLGNAEFLCAGSLGYSNALWDLNHPDNVHPVYNGVKYTVDEGSRVIGANKIFIMLGMNDIGLYGVDGAIENMKILTSRIEQKNPGAEIYIESVTPMLEDSQLRDLNNRSIAQFDEKLEQVCAERGYRYMDVASAVSDGYGNLVPAYCSDPTAMGLHFTDAGCRRWVEYLKNNVADN